MRSVEERYMTDPHFKNLVSLMEKMIMNYDFTPSEIREAAMFAATRCEMNRVRPPFIMNNFEKMK